MLKIKIIFVVTLMLITGSGVFVNQHSQQHKQLLSQPKQIAQKEVAKSNSAPSSPPTVATTPPATPPSAPPPAVSTHQPVKEVTSSCSNNKASQLILVSISQQHMWGCEGSSQVYESAVTTGASNYGDDTPIGTWRIYSKQTSRYLTGSDSRGSWNDYVNFWIPFNGDYGFHDATWQTMSFGDADYVNNGSHGCVRLPLSTATWLYNWSVVGTLVTIQ